MKNQKGSTLIVVLLLLVVITVIGTFAIRQSMVSLSIATNSQAQQLLMQSSDAVLYRISNSNFASTSGNPTSLLGYALKNEGNEVVFCFRSQINADTTFSVGSTSLLAWNDTNTDVNPSGVSGFCDLTKASDFVSSRKAQITQVTIVANPPSNNSSKPLQSVSLGTDLGSLGKLDEEQSKKIRVYVTSLLPNMSSAKATDIIACLKRPSEKPLSGSQETIDACLLRENVPFNTQVQDFVLDTYLGAVT
jgi:Tfp pilus assembly protein PilX